MGIERTIVLLLMLLLGPISSEAQTRYYSQTYDINDGLKQMQVNAVKIAKDKTVWLGTRSGICSFNGEQFDRFEDIDNKPDYVHDIDVMSDGRIVILNHKGLYLFDGQEFTLYAFEEIDRKAQFGRIFVDWKDRVWLNGTKTKNILLFDRGQYISAIDSMPFANIENPHAVIPNNCFERLYLFTKDNKVIEYDEPNQSGRIIYQAEQSLFIPRNIKSNFDCEQHPNRLLLLGERTNKKAKRLAYTNERRMRVLMDRTRGGKINTENPLYYLSDNALQFWDGQANVTLIENVKKEYNYFQSLDASDDVIFVGTDKGLIEFRKSPFTHFDESDYPNVWTVVEDEHSNILIGAWGQGIRYLDGDHQKIKGKTDKCENKKWEETPIGSYMGAIRTQAGRTIFPMHKGLLESKNNALHILHESEDCKNAPTALFIHEYSKTGDLYVASCPGVYVMDVNGHWKKTIQDSLFNHKCILTINEDIDGLLWFGGRNGVASYNPENERVQNFEFDKADVPLRTIMCSMLDHKGRLWFGGKNGLCFLQDGQFHLFEGFKNEEVNALTQTDDNKVFIATLKGIYMFDLAEYYATGVIRYVLYDENQGYKGLEPGQNGFYKDDNGLLWVCSSTSLAKVNPDQLSYNLAHLEPKIIKVNNIRVPFSGDEISLKEGINDVRIHYSLAGFNKERNIEYRYRLNQREWSNWSRVTEADFSDLASGNYTFTLQARSADLDSDISETHAKFSVDVLLWDEPYFSLYSLITSLFLVLFCVLLYRNNTLSRRVNELLEKEKNELVFKTSELEKLNKDLQVQIGRIANQSTESISSKLEIRSNDKTFLVEANTIQFIQAEDNGSRIFFEDRSLWTDVSLKSLEAKLDFPYMIRVHRSHIINISFLEWINQSHLQLSNGNSLKIGRTYKKHLLEMSKKEQL